ncbi:MAG: nitrilase-related carbon-nitrogen hydrolase, partial [Ktedonobacterales bacterium]
MHDFALPRTGARLPLADRAVLVRPAVAVELPDVADLAVLLEVHVRDEHIFLGIAGLGDDDFYGTSYFVNARGEITAEASDKEEEVLVADLDLEKNREVRNVWQF